MQACAIALGSGGAPNTGAQGSATLADQLKPNDQYAGMLARVLQGGTTVDLRAFRIAGALRSRPNASHAEQAEHATFSNLLTNGDFQGALESANRALDRNYASLIGHSDAMIACQALQKTEEAAMHERLLNALIGSIQKSGDGMGPQSAWFVVTVPEEYLFLSRVLRVTRRSQSLVHQDGHAYDRLEVIDPRTNQTRYLWFNTDVDMGLYDSTQNAAAPQSSAPVAAATAEVVNPSKIDGIVVRAGAFHLAEEGISSTATWGVIYDLSGTYIVRPGEVLVTLETGSARRSDSVATDPVLGWLRLGVCYQISTDGRFGMLPRLDPGQELSLNNVSLKRGDVFKFPSRTFRIPLPKVTPARNWLCSSLLEPNGGSYPAHDAGRPILIPPAAVRTQIRVRNSSDVDFEDVVVGEKRYGDIKAGATTDYQVWESAYRYAHVSLSAGPRPMSIRPIDFVGEPQLGRGSFTYVLTIEKDRLEIHAEKDTAASPPPVTGDGVSAPILLYKKEPEYSEKALKAKYQGTVLLDIEVDPSGKAANIRVKRGLGMGLDEKAIEAVRQWRFKPGYKDGKPVTVSATVQVSFRLRN
jgi:TonB family protein